MEQGIRLSNRDLVTFLFVTISFVPCFLQIRSMGSLIAFDLGSLIWRLLFYRDGEIAFRISLHLMTWHYYILKYVFIVQACRYYQGKTTVRRLAIVGILSEIQAMAVIGIPAALLLLSTGGPLSAYLWYLPIPSGLLIVGLLVRLLPREEPTPSWIEKGAMSWS